MTKRKRRGHVLLGKVSKDVFIDKGTFRKRGCHMVFGKCFLSHMKNKFIGPDS